MFKVQGSRFKVTILDIFKRSALSAICSAPLLYLMSITIIVAIFVFSASITHAKERLLWGFALDGYPITQQKLKDVESETGLIADITVFFLQWPSPEKMKDARFPLESLENIWNRGSVPCITWEPMYYRDNMEIMIHYKDILNGSYDSYITAYANQSKLWGKPFMIRFAHEMNLKRYHWGTAEKDYGQESPVVYRNMFRHIVSLFRKAGASNVLWVFCPNAESVPQTSYDKTASWNIIKNYYPGDDYVDILGIDGYNWGTTQKKEKHGWDSQWRTFNDIFKSARDELVSISSKKDILIFETATIKFGGSKTLWIKEALETSKKWGLAGIVWFQSNKELDWRIESTGEFEYINIIRPSTSSSHKWIKNTLKDSR